MWAPAKGTFVSRALHPSSPLCQQHPQHRHVCAQIHCNPGQSICEPQTNDFPRDLRHTLYEGRWPICWSSKCLLVQSPSPLKHLFVFSSWTLVLISRVPFIWRSQAHSHRFPSPVCFSHTFSPCVWTWTSLSHSSYQSLKTHFWKLSGFVQDWFVFGSAKK